MSAEDIVSIILASGIAAVFIACAFMIVWIVMVK